jgi:hypothetical protein
VSNAQAMSQSGKPRLSVVGKSENESAVEEKSSSSRDLLGILSVILEQGARGSKSCG